MLSPAQGLLRGLRAACLGVVAFVLASVAHVVAGGAAPGPGVFLLLAGLIGMASVLLTGARLRPVRVVVSLAGMQVLLHEAFMRLSAPAGCVLTGMRTPSGGHVAMGHGAQLATECATGMVHAGMGQGFMSSAMIMLGAHVAATVLMAALLAYGEKVLWFLAVWVRPARWLPTCTDVLSAFLVYSFGAPREMRVRYACGGVGRRGPPPWGPFAIV